MGNEDGFKHIPFRIYLKEENPIQRLQKTHDENGQELTLGDLINSTANDRMKEGS